MSNKWIRLFSCVLLAAAGCRERANPNSSGKDSEQVGVIYNAKSGLLVPLETAKFIGLETAEVSERPIQSVQEITARVFGTAPNESRVLASALICTNEAFGLHAGLNSIASTNLPSAKVVRCDTGVETQSGMLETILEVNDPDHRLREGGFVTFRFATVKTNVVTVVPNVALLHTMGGQFVYLENGAHLIRAAVELGRTDGEFTEIRDGLLVGDKVVVRPVMTLWMTELHNVNGGDACCVKQGAKK